MVKKTHENIAKEYKTSRRGKKNRLDAVLSGQKKKREANNALKLEQIRIETIRVVKNPSIPKSISGQRGEDQANPLEESFDSLACSDKSVISEQIINEKKAEILVKDFIKSIALEKPQRVSQKKLKNFYDISPRGVSFEAFNKAYKKIKKNLKNYKRFLVPKPHIPPHIKAYEYDEEKDHFDSINKLVNEPIERSRCSKRQARKEHIEKLEGKQFPPQEYKLKFLYQNQMKDKSFKHSNLRAWKKHFYSPRMKGTLAVTNDVIYRPRRTGMFKRRGLYKHRSRRFRERPKRQGIIRKFQLAAEHMSQYTIMTREKMKDLWKEISGSKERQFENEEEIRAFLDSYIPKEDSDH